MSISAGLWSAGEVVWSIYEVGMGVQVPYPSLADAGFLAAVPFAFAGIRAFWSDARGTSSRWRVWFDGVIVALALTSTAWAFGLKSVWQSSSSTKLLDLAYPVSDIVIGTILILAIRRANQQQAGRMAFLLAGIASYSIADSAFAYLTANGTYDAIGSVLDAGWVVGYLLIALAPLWPARYVDEEVAEGPIELWQLALPWVASLAAAVMAVRLAVIDQNLDRFATVLAGGIGILFVANHAFDCIGAKSYGMRTAFIDRRKRPFGETPHQPDLILSDFAELASALV